MRTSDVRVRRAIAAVGAGRPVVVTDDAAQGYLVFAAETATSTLLAFTVRHTSGYVRIALPGTECDRLDLPPVCNGGHLGATQRVAVDWGGVGTGISATDRAATIVALAAQASSPSDFRRPGHVVPVLADADGVLAQPAVAEAAVDLARLGGRRPAGVLCEIVSGERVGAIADEAESIEFADRHGLGVISIPDLAQFRRRTEPQVVRSAETLLPLGAVTSRAIGFRDTHGGGEHLVAIIGAADSDRPMPLHVHVECLTGDVFGSLGCCCADDLHRAVTTMTARGSGMIVYLRPPGPVGACGLSTRDALGAERVSQIVAWILRDLGVHSVRLSDDAPGFGLVMFGAIREHGLVAGQHRVLAVAG
ncbi:MULTISPECIES: 3,4-dihydroxy-2-butanone-4-phosphate synthase [Mycobacterium]|uniref:3,4-dihydroxy-2-butanone-4-phosphate synthase n=1 Tax=Mycobacterium TaxID=1763 RepID=UPI0013D0EC2D|nr:MULTISPECIES: 3,4-dihydroxy-2-butanone-4-phosphate synthase [Mycobacterium]MDV3130738.1 3,4-dihydroxy-2-butanone-4-phosphate synthase [Mycobacterium sp. 29Ha]